MVRGFDRLLLLRYSARLLGGRLVWGVRGEGVKI